DGCSMYFVFIKACPRCSIKRSSTWKQRDEKINKHKWLLEKAHKPVSQKIGEIAADSFLLILHDVLHRVAPHFKVGKSTQQQGDIDLVIYNEKILALGEIKASPFVVYPLEVRLPDGSPGLVRAELIGKKII